jgi:hypothetical protein
MTENTLIALVSIIIIAATVGGALAYIIISKKRGKRCIGCPDSGKCSGCCSQCGICGSDSAENKENTEV